MFDFLKKKISGLIDKVVGKAVVEEKPVEDKSVKEKETGEKAIEKEIAHPPHEKAQQEPLQEIETPAASQAQIPISQMQKQPAKTFFQAEKPKEKETEGKAKEQDSHHKHKIASRISTSKSSEPEKTGAGEEEKDEDGRKEEEKAEEKKAPISQAPPSVHKKTETVKALVSGPDSRSESIAQAHVQHPLPSSEDKTAKPGPKLALDLASKPEDLEEPKKLHKPVSELSSIPPSKSGRVHAQISEDGEKGEKEKEKEKPRQKKVSLSIMSQLKSVLSSEVELAEADVSGVLDEFEMELLESDVAFAVAGQIKEDLRSQLVGRKISKGKLKEEIARVFFESILSIMAENKGAPILERVQLAQDSAKPIKIMFIGPNGSGKTTTIAKIANMLLKSKYSVAIAAADTFRAAAIEQMEIHGKRLGVRVIAGKYGADPTSVAFDAVNYAKAHKIDVVLIDTAGRQETNTNLLSELKKMARVINPDIKVYVGESIAGNSVIEQVGAFNKELKLDGVILTKLDCDAKGGTVISISKVTRVPVLYVTTGQGYDDIEEFDEEKIARNIAG